MTDDRPDVVGVVLVEPEELVVEDPEFEDPEFEVDESDEEFVPEAVEVVPVLEVRPAPVAEWAVVSDATRSPRPAAASVAATATVAVSRRTRVIARARARTGVVSV